MVDLGGDAGRCSVKSLLEECYDRACNYKIWNVVREVAGILRKVVNSLTINLTDLLIRQKYVTIGFGDQEYTVNKPLSPDKLVDIIYGNSQGYAGTAPLIQEILIYLGSLIRSEPQLFDGILRIRTYNVVVAMREEVSRIRACDEESAVELMMQLSPMEMKSLLNYTLSAKDTTP